MAKLRFALIVTFLFQFSLLSFAHEETSEMDPYDKVFRYGLLFEKVSKFELSQSEEPRKGTPFVRLNGRRYYINDSFYEMTEAILHLYTKEIRDVCPSCEIPSVERMNEEAKALVARGYFQELKEDVLLPKIGPVAGEFVDLGARYGKLAGALKVGGEVAEEALLIVFKMPGAHFLCDAITWLIATKSGGVLTFGRTFGLAGHFNRNGFRQLIRMTATSWVAKKAFRRIQIKFGPAEVDPSLLGEQRSSDPEKEWLAEEITEEKNYRNFFQRVQKMLEASTAKEKDLLQQIENRTAEGRSTKRMERRLAELRYDRAKATQVHRKVFEGRRYKRSLWIFRRNGPKSLYSNEQELNSHLRGSKAWMVPLTANVIEPGFEFQGNMNERAFEDYMQRTTAQRPQPANNGAEAILLQEASDRGLNPDRVKSTFADIEFIFDPTQSRNQRGIHVISAQSFYGEFLYRSAKEMVKTIRKEVVEREKTGRSLRRVLALNWKVTTLSYYSNYFTNYLLSASLERGENSNLIFEKEFAKEYATRIVEGYGILSELKTIPNSEKILEINKVLDAHIERLKANMFWIEKKARRRMIPVRGVITTLLGFPKPHLYRKRVQCSKLYY